DLMFVGPEAHCYTSGRGLAHIDTMLTTLASVRPCRTKPFGSLPPLVLEHVAMLSSCICVLLGWDEERREFVRVLRDMGLAVLVLVIVDSEEPAALDPGPLEGSPGQLHRLVVGSIEEGLAAL
ncbi:DUF58 domain-containing protein, partial [Thermodesulfobacteriota bacterium]